MHDMLMISDSVTTDGTDWHPYTERGYWTGEETEMTSAFPSDTSAGELYIADNANDELRNSCVLELNLGDVDFGVVRDSSGNGNKAVLIGDFSITKSDIHSPTMRDSYMEIPERGLEEKAL
jgi:hypothetical protein